MRNCFCLLAWLLSLAAAADTVKLYEKDEIIPTNLFPRTT